MTMVGINPLTNKLEPLVGYYANVMSVARAIPLLAAELRSLPDHTTHQKLSARHAKALLDAIQPVHKVDFDDIKVAISDAVKHLRGLIKNDAAAGKLMDIIDAVELLADEM